MKGLNGRTNIVRNECSWGEKRILKWIILCYYLYFKIGKLSKSWKQRSKKWLNWQLKIVKYTGQRRLKVGGGGGRVLLDKILISDPVRKLIRNKECNYYTVIAGTWAGKSCKIFKYFSLKGWLKTRYFTDISLCLRYEIRRSLSFYSFKNSRKFWNVVILWKNKCCVVSLFAKSKNEQQSFEYV